jgi:hypothetical protein
MYGTYQNLKIWYFGYQVLIRVRARTARVTVTDVSAEPRDSDCVRYVRRNVHSGACDFRAAGRPAPMPSRVVAAVSAIEERTGSPDQLGSQLMMANDHIATAF